MGNRFHVWLGFADGHCGWKLRLDITVGHCGWKQKHDKDSGGRKHARGKSKDSNENKRVSNKIMRIVEEFIMVMLFSSLFFVR